MWQECAHTQKNQSICLQWPSQKVGRQPRGESCPFSPAISEAFAFRTFARPAQGTAGHVSSHSPGDHRAHLLTQPRGPQGTSPHTAQGTAGHVSSHSPGDRRARLLTHVWMACPYRGLWGKPADRSSEWQQLNSFLCENTGALIASSDTWDSNYSMPLLCH